MDTVRIQIENAREVQDALNKFERNISKKIVRQAVRAAWTPLLEKAKQNARALSKGGEMMNLIADNLQLRAFRRQKKESYGMHVALKKGVEEFVSFRKTEATMRKKFSKWLKGTRTRYFIPSAIEYGHAFPGRGGSGAKDVAAMPFMRPALDATLPKAPKIMEEYLNKAIAEENAKK